MVASMPLIESFDDINLQSMQMKSLRHRHAVVNGMALYVNMHAYRARRLTVTDGQQPRLSRTFPGGLLIARKRINIDRQSESPGLPGRGAPRRGASIRIELLPSGVPLAEVTWNKQGEFLSPGRGPSLLFQPVQKMHPSERSAQRMMEGG